MKTLKSSPLHLSLLPYLMVLLFLFSAYPAMAAPKQAHSEDKLGIQSIKTFTFTGSSSLIARSTKPEIVLFSRARDNPKADAFSSDSTNGSFTPFNSLGTWINTTVTGDSGYSFGGFTCTNCPKAILPLEFHLNKSKLTATDQVTPDGDTIFRLNEHQSVGVSFQLGTQHPGHNAYLPPLNIDNSGIAQVGNIETYFNNAVSIYFLVRVKLHLLNNQIPNNVQDILLTDLDLGYIKLKRSQFQNNKRVTFIIEDKGSITVKLQPPKIRLIHQQRQCYLSNNGGVPSIVTLKKVKKSEFDNTDEIEGGSFRLRVSCNRQENQINNQWLFPRVMITFKGEQNTTNNGSSDLLKTQTGSGQATGVSLIIKRNSGNGDSVKYGPDSANMKNPGQFAVHQQPSEGDTNARETFKVYYVRDTTRGALTEGKVKAAATFTMSYQ
ncbi:fimbrial protein [Haemophilus haemolyticus]|uniref:Pilus assembly protein PilC n=1 Tax=Haemophilus haemolyticus M19501 TaxID=1028803 RepID=F9GM87_HAEHA|nr:fimbrial protein [Haemophilus haemolyticus]EGT77331.1 pilus assembly protein PilC [Haemophilus haemolyticus M19501]